MPWHSAWRPAPCSHCAFQPILWAFFPLSSLTWQFCHMCVNSAKAPALRTQESLSFCCPCVRLFCGRFFSPVSAELGLEPLLSLISWPSCPIQCVVCLEGKR